MENQNSGLIKVESSIISAGNQLLKLQNTSLAHYYSELRKWWNDLDDDWKLELIHLGLYEEGIPRELLAQGKLFTKNRQSPGISEWEVIVDEKGKIHRELLDSELEKIVLTWELNLNSHEDLKPLAKLENLKFLSVRNQGIRSLAGIEELINLRSIDAAYSSITNLEPLQKLFNLEDLNISHTNSTLTD